MVPEEEPEPPARDSMVAVGRLITTLGEEAELGDQVFPAQVNPMEVLEYSILL